MKAPIQKVYTTEQLKLVYNKNKVFEGSTGTLVNLATEYGLVCPSVGCFNFERVKVLIFKLFGRQSHRKAVIM
jgi:hypothetical protein